MNSLRKQWQPAFLSILLFAASCNAVKENRTDCPCSLFITLGALPDDPVEICVYADEERPCYDQALDSDTTLVVQVPGRKALVLGVSGAALDQDARLHIPYGSDCPAVYLAAHEVQTVRDTAHCRVQLHKHFCALRLRFEGPPGWGEPYSVRIRGPVEGLSPDGTPLPGPFSYSLEPGAGCRLPRQAPGEALWLDITLPEGVLRSFALGAYMEEAGYDWTAPDLKDIVLQIDLSVTAIRFTLDQWTTTVALNIEI